MKMRVLLFLCLGICYRAEAALAVPELDLTTPTGSWWMHNASEAQIRAKMDEGFRVIRLDRRPEAADRYSAAFVANSGPYHEDFAGWIPDMSQDQLKNIENDPGRRIIDLSMYLNAQNNLTFTVVWVGNTGAQKKKTKTLFTTTVQGIRDFSDPANFRVIDVEYIKHPIFGEFYMSVLVEREVGNERCQEIGQGSIENIYEQMMARETSAAGAPCPGQKHRIIALDHVNNDQFVWVAETRLNQEQPWYFADLNYMGINGVRGTGADHIPSASDLKQIDNLGVLTDRLMGRITDVKHYSVGGQDRYLALVTDNEPFPQCGSTSGPERCGPPGSTNATLKAVDKIMQDAMKKWGVPGGTVAIMEGPRLVYAQGYGFSRISEGEPRQPRKTDPTTMFRVASISKSITSLAILKLIEDGVNTPIGRTALTLDTKPFVDIFPCNTFCTTMDQDLKKVTIRQLLQHKTWFNPALSSESNENNYMSFAVDLTKVPPVKTVYVGRNAPAGSTNSLYQNGNFALLTRVVDILAAPMTYKTYVEKKFLEPLLLDAGDMRITVDRLFDFDATLPSVEAAGYFGLTQHNRRCWDNGNGANPTGGKLPSDCPDAGGAAGTAKWKVYNPGDPGTDFANDWINDATGFYGAGSWAATPAAILRILASADGSLSGPRIIGQTSFEKILGEARLGTTDEAMPQPIPNNVSAYLLGFGQKLNNARIRTIEHNGILSGTTRSWFAVRDDDKKFFVDFNADIGNGLFFPTKDGKPGTFTFNSIAAEVETAIHNLLDGAALPVEDHWSDFGLPLASGADCAGVPAWRVGTYSGGSKVQTEGTLYQCKSAPQSAWCGQIGYAPGMDAHWRDAWNEVDQCVSGILPMPTSNCGALQEWQIKTYVGGNRVKHGGNIYQCKGWPQSGWCGQAGYEPGVTAYWPDAWVKVSGCATTGPLPLLPMDPFFFFPPKL